MLLTVWAILIAGGLTAYFTTRSVVLASIDKQLVARATVLGGADRYIVKNDRGLTLETRIFGASPQTPTATLVRAAFVRLDDGQRVRSALVRTEWKKDDGTSEPVTVTISESAEVFDRLMNRLALALLVTGCIGGLVAAFVARAVARIALRPLLGTAETIGSIDERNLSRRIDSSKLAPELLPVADRLNEMLARLETSFANRKQFLADASHELRTPVAAMVTTLEVALRRLRDAESYRATMQTCLADARLMRALIDALMQQARAEIGSFSEPPVETNVSALLHECVDILRATADEKQIRLSTSIGEPIALIISPGRLRQAVMGLLENAIDHNTPGGEVSLSASAARGQLLITIRDTGPGIAPEHLPRIFEPFYRASSSRSRDENGHLGLGLFLVKSHIDALGGTCSVESTLGSGSQFQIALPIPVMAKMLQSPLATAVTSGN